LRLPVSIFLKPWYRALTRAERGLLLEIVEDMYAMRTRYIEDTSEMRVRYVGDTNKIRMRSFEKFQRLGIISDLTHRQGRKEGREERKKALPNTDIEHTKNYLTNTNLPTLIDLPTNKELTVAANAPRSKSEQFDQVREAWKRITKKTMLDTQKNRDRVAGCFKRGHSLEDICMAIEEKYLQWQGDLKMDCQIKPQVILGSHHIDDYVEEAKQDSSLVSQRRRTLEQEKLMEQQTREAEEKIMAGLQVSQPEKTGEDISSASSNSDDDDDSFFNEGPLAENPFREQVLQTNVQVDLGSILERVRANEGILRARERASAAADDRDE
jgi:hypothetical protein